MKPSKLALSLCLLLVTLFSGCGGGNGGGCTSNEMCAENQFCKLSSCTGGSGVCSDKPSSCTNEGPAVCTCDHISFFNECWADAAGQSVAASGECTN